MNNFLFLLTLAALGAVFYVDIVEGDLLTLSRHDCFVLADKECDRFGWAAEVDFNRTSLRCEFMCRPPRWQVRVQEISFWFMKFNVLTKA